ncbi:uncharacterized protein [Branchiostoma lanceolatum]|uniref:uncharacterized protein n=1 Tax=Branchiostoma lanceolatum TaxID=7740 RepID=UPI00345228A9
MLAILAIALLMSTPLSAEMVYLTSIQGWSYYKVRVSGLMTSTNIKAACVAEGMMYPCMRANLDCYGSQWTADCPVLPDVGTDIACRVQVHISNDMCGTTEPENCPPLDDTFISIPDYHNGDVCGIDHETDGWCVDGAQVSNLYATCVIKDPIPAHNGKCYQLSKHALNHADAGTKCASLGGSLAAIKDRGEQSFLADQISHGSNVSHWIGLKSTPATFIFSDFSQLGNSLEWVPGEPDNLCVLLARDGGYKCKTDLCHASHNYVCQSGEKSLLCTF